MIDLTTLWRSRASAILHAAAVGEADYREVANLAAHIGADYHDRFLIELIQNAEDQAVKVRLTGATVTVIRTTNLVAVANQGAPFSEAGLREITSAGISSKDPTIAIGNKGVGFKAAFQVTSAPEVYSSHASGLGFAEEDGTRFCLASDPFSDSDLLKTVREHVTNTLEADPALCELLRSRFGTGDLFEPILGELRTAAPFKFPLPLKRGHLRARLDELQLPSEACAAVQTLVVLPLLEDERTQVVVERALDELCARAGSILLFLSGTGCVRIIDRPRAMEMEVTKKALTEPEPLAGWTTFRSVRTAVKPMVGESQQPHEADYWLVSRTLGRCSASEEAEAEEEALKAAAESIPGANWCDFHSATVTIAFPKAGEDESGLGALEPDGQFFIGLPTHDGTGTPVLVNAPFHGTLSRTGLNLAEPLNSLLFKEAVRLFWSGVERLKTDSDVSVRRAATLMFNFGDGHLAQALSTQVSVCEAEVVLAEDGCRFIAPRELVMPAKDDIVVFDGLRALVGEATKFGFVLPDKLLMHSAYDLLVSLAGGEQSAQANDGVYLERSAEGPSFLEAASTQARSRGREFWEEYLGWLVERFDLEQIEGQIILPTTGEQPLSASSERVFIRPLPVTDGEDSEEENEEEPTEAIPDEILSSLRFLDEACVQVRAEGRAYTELARELAPADHRGLVRAPRTPDLINDALSPKLHELATDPAHFGSVMGLLLLASRWLSAMGEQNRSRVREDPFIVPVKNDDGELTWASPRYVYFGQGWLGQPADGLLAQAYGHMPGRRLIPWPEFSRRLQVGDGERSEWAAVMRNVGVAAYPRIVHATKRRLPPWYAASDYSMDYDSNVSCPIQAAREYWHDYLSFVSFDRGTATKGRQPYDVVSLCWIDGLEDERARSAALQLILSAPNLYLSEMTTIVHRRYTEGDPSRVLTFWMFALQHYQWPVIPTTDGLKPPQASWFPTEDERRQEFATRSLLPMVAPRYADARPILASIDVCSIAAAPLGRLVDALHLVASALTEEDPTNMRAYSSLTHTLYAYLEDRCEDAGEPEPLDALRGLCEAPVPLAVGRRLVPADLPKLDVLYLNDDPTRASLIPGIDTAHVLPISPRKAPKALFEQLQALLGEPRVVRTSKAPVDTGFVRNAGVPPIPLLDYLGSQFPERDVASDLGVLYAYGRPGARSVTPSEDAFGRTWRVLRDTCIHVGSFLPTACHRSAFVAADDGRPVLQVSKLSGVTVIESCWPVFGSAYRDLLAAYVRAFENQSLELFFSDRGTGPAERDEVDAVIGRRIDVILEKLKPILLALWWRGREGEDARTFENGWAQHANVPQALATWLGIPNLDAIVDRARGQVEEEEDPSPLLAEAGITVEEWQRCRVALGMEHFRFRRSVHAFQQARDYVVAALTALAARSERTDLAAARSALEALVDRDCPAGFASKPATPQEALRAVVRVFGGAIARLSQSHAEVLWQRKLADLAKELPNSLEASPRADPPNRDVREYLGVPEGIRSASAQEVARGIIRVACALAEQADEQLIADELTAGERMQLLMSGWWANRYCVLVPLRTQIARRAPKTARRLAQARAFRDPCSYGELVQRFPELGQLDGDRQLDRRRQREYELVGIEGTAGELEADLADGREGRIGAALREAIDTDIDLTKLGNADRLVLPDSPKHKEKRGRRTGGGGSATAYDPTISEMVGRLGEAFVYETLRERLPDFGGANWVSGARTAYGFDGDGDDGLGYDFHYCDDGGG